MKPELMKKMECSRPTMFPKEKLGVVITIGPILNMGSSSLGQLHELG